VNRLSTRWRFRTDQSGVRRVPGQRRRGVSGFGLLLIILGLLGLAVAYSVLPSIIFKLWPVIFVGAGLFGLLKRPGWVQELDLHAGPEVSRVAMRPQRFLSWILLVGGVVLLVFTTNLVDQRLFGPALLIALGLFLIWRRTR
jgi:hypothetical protein